NTNQQHDHHRDHGANYLRQKLLESIGGQKQVQSDRRREISQFHVCQEENSQMDRVKTKSLPQRRNEWNLDDDGRKNIHQAADNQQKHIEQQQKHPSRVNGMRGPFYSPGRDLGVDQVVREPKRYAQDQQHASDEKPAFGHHARDLSQLEIAV